MTTQALNDLADKVVIANATGNETLYNGAVSELLTAVRALATVSDAPPSSDAQPDGDVLAIAQAAIDLMTEFHGHAQPDETPDMNAVFPAAEFRKFVDQHARLMYRMAQYRKAPLEPAYLRLRKAADEVCAVLGAHGEISARDDRVQTLLDALYGTDDGAPEKAKPVYAAVSDAQPVAPNCNADGDDHDWDKGPEAAGSRTCEQCGFREGQPPADGWIRQTHAGPASDAPLFLLGAPKPEGFAAKYRPVYYASPAPDVRPSAPASQMLTFDNGMQLPIVQDGGGFKIHPDYLEVTAQPPSAPVSDERIAPILRDLRDNMITVDDAIFELRPLLLASQPAAQVQAEQACDFWREKAIKLAEELGRIKLGRDAAQPQEAGQAREIEIYNDLNRTYGNTLSAMAKHLAACGYSKATHAAPAVPLTDKKILELVDQCKPGGKENPYADPWLDHHYLALARDLLTAAPSAPSVSADARDVELPPLPDPLEIDWPQLNSSALGCGVEDRGIRDRYDAAEYGWQDGMDKAAERVPDEIFDAEQMREYARAAIAAQSKGAKNDADSK